VNYLSVFSGIDAPTVAWHPLGWRPVAFAEIEKFARAVLAHHYPLVPNLGDVARFAEWPDADVDVLVGGTPCQSYSIAGLRKGLDDPRGDLTLTYVAVARRYRPAWIVWENVPNILSLDEGRAFGSLLGLLAGSRIEAPPGGFNTAGIVPGIERAYGIAWRVLDAQYVRVDGLERAVPQRRRRVFVVGYLGDWRRAAAVLFEREGVQGNPPPGRATGQRVSPTLEAHPTGGGVSGSDFLANGGLIPDVAKALRASTGGIDREDGHTIVPAVANALTARMGKGVNTTMNEGQTMIAQAIAFSCKDRGMDVYEDVAPPLRAMHHVDGNANAGGQIAVAALMPAVADPVMTREGMNYSHAGNYAGLHNVVPAVAFQPRYARNGRGAPDTVASALTAQPGSTGKGDSAQCVATEMGVRRLTPRECERLQGFPDDFTLVPYRGALAKDGPRYRVLGNAMPVGPVRWIGQRIDMVEELRRTAA
jgi:DNA (cytosine-5)-methyltransferase 1